MNTLTFPEIKGLRYRRALAAGWEARGHPHKAEYIRMTEKAQRFIWKYHGVLPMESLFFWYNMVLYPDAKIVIRHCRFGSYGQLVVDGYYDNRGPIIALERRDELTTD